jgi:hypothetical protein
VTRGSETVRVLASLRIRGHRRDGSGLLRLAWPNDCRWTGAASVIARPVAVSGAHRQVPRRIRRGGEHPCYAYQGENVRPSICTPVPVRRDVQRSAQQGLAWHSPITPSWASSISHWPLSCRITTRRTSCMCGPRVSFNAARRVEVPVVSITQGISLEAVDLRCLGPSSGPNGKGVAILPTWRRERPRTPGIDCVRCGRHSTAANNIRDKRNHP